MRITADNINGTIKRDTEVYVVEDNTTLQNLTVSKTILHAGKATSGHFHDNLDEVYFFTSGQGVMQVGERIFSVNSGDIVLIPGGEFHRVTNNNQKGKQDLVFICVFQSYER
jgi:mannose-6-phosphate isomerase-like protein (cupin superfamily)